MTLVPNSTLLRDVAHARRERLQASVVASRSRADVPRLRVRVGRMLMSAGASISGDRLEMPAQRPAASHPAA